MSIYINHLKPLYVKDYSLLSSALFLTLLFNIIYIMRSYIYDKNVEKKIFRIVTKKNGK